MKKSAFTLIEMIISIVILGILSAGTFVSIKNLYLKVAKSKAISELSSDSQNIVDQISLLLYDRVPSSVIGYDGVSSFESIYNMNQTYEVLEWLGTSVESLKKREYSGLVDLDDSNGTIKSPDTSVGDLETTTERKFQSVANALGEDSLALAFAGTFDDGQIVYSQDFNNSFGWHGNGANLLYVLDVNSTGSDIVLETQPNAIYEKYYIVDSAYAIARGEHVNLNAPCISDLNRSVKDNTLFLFFDYRPWRQNLGVGETYCADSAGGNQRGSVTILSNEISGFEIGLLNDNIYFNLTSNRGIPKRRAENNVTISKQKVVY